MRLVHFWVPVVEQAGKLFVPCAEPGADDGAARPADAEGRAGEVAAMLVEQLDAAKVHSLNAGFDPATVEHALYAVVAWLDEVAMTTAWPGRAGWRAQPLQRTYFATAEAGEQFFMRLDGLDAEANDVREVFGVVLLAGFRGRFAGRHPHELADYRQRLLQQLAQARGMAPLNVRMPLFPQLGQLPAAGTGMPARRRVTLAGALVVGLPLVALAGLYGIYDWSLRSLANTLLATF